MPDIFYRTGGNFSALTPQVIAASYLTPTLNSTGQYDALNTERYQAFTASVAGDMEGAYICLYGGAASGSNTVTVKLQQNTGSWVDVAGATGSRTYNDIAGAHTDVYVGGMRWIYVPFGTPATIDTASNKWRIAVVSSTSIFSWRKSGSSYAFAVVLTTTTSYSSGDNILFCDQISVVQDQAITATTMVWGCNVHFGVPSTVAASYALTITTALWSKDARLYAGEDTSNRVPAANQYQISIATLSTALNYEGAQQFEIELWGAKPTSVASMLAATANSGQPVIVTEDDMSAAWSPGDQLLLLGSDHATTAHEFVTVSSITGTSVTLTGNLTYKHWSGFAAINWTQRQQCGVKWTLTNNFTASNCCVMRLSGLWLYATGTQIISNTGYTNEAGSSRLTPRVIDGVFLDQACLSVNPNFYGAAGIAALTGGQFSEVWGYAQQSYHAIIACTGMWTGTISDVYIGRGLTIFTEIVDSALSDMQFCGASTDGSSYRALALSAVGSIISNLRAYIGYYGIYAALIRCTLTDVWADGANTGLLINGTTIDCTINNLTFGAFRSNATRLGIASGVFAQCILNNSTGATPSGIASAVGGSFIKFHKYDLTADDHRSFWVLGNMQSVGDGLSDTTVHTPGTGAFAIRLQPTSSTSRLEWQFVVPTGDIAGATMTVAVWCKINSATYYAGTHQLPRLTVNYDNGTTTYVEASETTDWQLLALSFSPTTDYGQITVTLSGMTDASGSGAYVYFDDIALLYPANSILDLGALDIWANALPVVPPLAIPLSSYTVAAAVWSALRSVYTASGSFGATDEWAGSVDEAGIATAVRTELTPELENMDAAVSSRNAVAPLDAAGIRSAVGLTSANLDDQLAALPTAGENRDAVIAGLQAEDPPIPANVTYQNGDANTVPTVLAAILEDTGTTLPGLMAAELSNTSDSTASGAITRTRGNTWSISATIGAITGYTSLWFTVKHSKDDADSEAILQIKLNEPSANDGLIYKNGSDSVTAGNGSITVSDDTTGEIIIALDEADTDDMPVGAFYYDIQALIGSTITTPDSGTFTVTADVTRSIT